jgi:hypothetical protein
MAGDDVCDGRLVVDPPLAARFQVVSKVLDGIGQVHIGAIDARLCECFVENVAGGSDERFAGAILFVPGLLADEQQPGTRCPGGEDDVRGVLPEFATPASWRRLPQSIQIRISRNELLRTRPPGPRVIGVGHAGH